MVIQYNTVSRQEWKNRTQKAKLTNGEGGCKKIE